MFQLRLLTETQMRHPKSLFPISMGYDGSMIAASSMGSST